MAPVIRCSGETLLTLITDILDFSRIEANKMLLSPSLFKLQTVVEAAMEIAGLRAAQKRLQVMAGTGEGRGGRGGRGLARRGGPMGRCGVCK